MSDALERYVAGTLADEAQFEERLFADEALLGDATRLLALRDGLKAMAAMGPIVPVIPAAEVERLGQRFRITVHSPVDGRIATHIGAEDFVVARIPVDLLDARRIDVRFCSPSGEPFFLAREVPFDADGVVAVCRSHVAIASGTLRVQVVDQDARVRADVSIENLPAPG